MKTLNSLLSLVALLGLMVLAGCTAAPSLLGLGGHPSAGSGTAMVTLAGWDRQTQAVASDVSTVSVSVSPVGGNPVFGQRRDLASTGGSTSTAFTGLTAGVWRVEAIALGTTRATLGTATADVTIQAGQTAAVTLALRLAPTNGLELELAPYLGYVPWTAPMPEALESMDVVNAFITTSLSFPGNEWRYVLEDATGTRSATYSVVFEEGLSYLNVDVEGQAATTRKLSPANRADDLHAMPVGASLVATGSESVLGKVRPFRQFRFTLRYRYADGQWVQVKTDRWVAPEIGTYRERIEEGEPGAIATRSLDLTAFATGSMAP